MKKFYRRVVFLICLAMMAGCKESRVNSESIRIEDIRSTMMNISEVQFEEREDTQAYWNVFTHEVAAAENGYYYMFRDKQGNILEHMDPDTGERVIVCSNPQCGHNAADCPALFSGYAKAVWSYQEHLYFIKYGVAGKAVLVQTDQNVTQRKELFEIGNTPENNADVYNLVFCNNDVYIYNRNGNCASIGIGDTMQIKIRKRSLDGNRDEYIVTGDEEDSIFDALKAYGGNVFFVYTHTTFDNKTLINTTTSEGMFCYNGKTGKVGKVIDKAVSDYSMDEKNKILYYYVINEGLYKRELATGEERLIYQAEHNTTLCQVSCDENYVYLDNGRWCAFTGEKKLYGTGDAQLRRKVWILDTEGKELHCLDNADSYASFFGDGRCILTETEISDKIQLGVPVQFKPLREKCILKYIRKSDISSETLEWKSTTWE